MTISHLNTPSMLPQMLPDEPAQLLRAMSSRYGVTEAVILNLAPVLFHVVAQASLAQRHAALVEMEDAHQVISNFGDIFLLHGAGMFPRDRFEAAEDAERRSLDAEDVLGSQIADGSGWLAECATGPHEDTFARRNPLVMHLRLLASDGVSEIRVTAQVADYRVLSNRDAHVPPNEGEV